MVRPLQYPRLYLASGSPRRQEILAGLGLSFDVLSPQVDESRLGQEAPLDYVRRVARLKAETVAAQLPPGQAGLVLAADTSVVQGQGILGKPGSLEEARAMLQSLSGQWHEVLTSVALCVHGQVTDTTVISRVRFRPISPQEIEAYWATGEPADKAGAYGIQGFGGMFVEKIEGSYSAIVGLPVAETVALLSEHGLDALAIMKGART